LELLNVYSEGDFVARLLEAEPNGCGCSDTLEDFVIYPLGLSGIRDSNFEVVKSLTRLKSLCVGPKIFSKAEYPSAYLPTSLERLSIIEPEHFDDVDGSIELEDSKTGLVRFLMEKQYKDFAQLRTIRLRGLKEDWIDVLGVMNVNKKPIDRDLIEDFARIGVRLETKLIEGKWNRLPLHSIM
jgi:hypothetical protein